MMVGTEPDYRAALRRLTGLDNEAARLRAEADQWYADRVAATDDAVRAAEDAVRAADQAVRAAERDRDAIDARANGQWSTFVHDVGARQAERFGRTLPPPSVPRQRDRSADDYLDDVEALAKSAAQAKRSSGGLKTVFTGLGVAGGLAGVGADVLLRWAGHEAGGVWATALPVLALIVLLLTPALTLLIAGRRIADRRGATLDVATVATGLVAGLLTAGLLYAALILPTR
jgi:hypothetical protein